MVYSSEKIKKDVERRRSYPSDISRKQFAEIEPFLISARKITAPRKLDLDDVFLRFWNNERFNNIDGVLETIYKALN